MKQKLFSVVLLTISLPILGLAQNLTVEKIMRDPKWIGTSPSNAFWSADGKKLYFSWNPEGNKSDSVYVYATTGGTPSKASYSEVQREQAMSNAVFNTNRTQMVYSYRGDLYLQEISSGKTTRITRTEEAETAPRFILKDEWIVYTKNQNLYAWHIQEGITLQLTNIVRGTETPASSGAPRVPFINNNRGTNAGLNTGAATQDQWLRDQQLDLFQVLRERKAMRESRTEFNKTHRDTDTLKTIGIGDKFMQGLQVSPDGRFVTYRLITLANGKNTIVPDYLAESGFTTDINARTKVGAPLGKQEFFVYDRLRDRLISVAADSVNIPGIMDQPDYVKDYPAKYSGKKAPVRPVNFGALLWNDAGTAAILDIRSQDNKDRWLMQLNPETGALSLVNRQRDEAWIGGPGVSAFGASLGWINNELFYFQSEASGYSHIYTYNLKTKSTQQLTNGKYEVQSLQLSNDHSYFYLLTNEEHPGKQHWYRMKTDGSGKEKITSMTGGYEVSLSPDEKWIAYRYSYSNKPWELYIQENQPGKTPVQVTDKAASAEFKAYPWRDPKVISFAARDGQQVYARIYEPAKNKKNKAAVIFVHGAGYLQNVHYWWSTYFREYMFHNLLTDLGYTVLDIDYRASSGYGRDWRTGIYRFMGGKDLEDHVDAAKMLSKDYGIDANRIGIYGGSYGGFITLMGLFTTPDVFKAGAALRPVTDWAHYNHGYTSNILNEPVNDSIAYARSSPINFAQNLKNRLLICHGMVDVNVHFQDVVRLSQKLIELGKDNWELAAYPVEDHGFIEPSSWTDEYKRILKLFNQELLKK